MLVTLVHRTVATVGGRSRRHQLHWFRWVRLVVDAKATRLAQGSIRDERWSGLNSKAMAVEQPKMRERLKKRATVRHSKVE